MALHVYSAGRQVQMTATGPMRVRLGTEGHRPLQSMVETDCSNTACSGMITCHGRQGVGPDVSAGGRAAGRDARA